MALALAVTVQPVGLLSGALLAPPVVITATTSGLPDITFSGAVTLSVLGGNGVLLGTTVVSAVLGVATFSAVKVYGNGAVTLQASADSYGTVTTNALTVDGNMAVRRRRHAGAH